MKQLRFILFFVLVGLNLSSSKAQEIHYSHSKILFLKQKVLINVEIAKTDKQREIGLMGRKKLALGNGMLFIFEKQGIQRVWMKNTLIPLDVIFLSAQGEIVSFFKKLQPCKIEKCPIYNSAENAKLMLEVNAGIIDRKNVGIGDFIRLIPHDFNK